MEKEAERGHPYIKNTIFRNSVISGWMTLPDGIEIAAFFVALSLPSRTTLVPYWSIVRSRNGAGKRYYSSKDIETHVLKKVRHKQTNWSKGQKG